MEAQHILLPLEPGSGGEALVRSGIKLASALKAKLTFLYVMTASGYAGYTGSMAVASMVSLKEQKENIETHYIEILKKFKDDIPTSLVIERGITEGPWVPSIIDYLNKHQADILLLKHVEQGFIEKGCLFVVPAHLRVGVPLPPCFFSARTGYEEYCIHYRPSRQRYRGNQANTRLL